MLNVEKILIDYDKINSDSIEVVNKLNRIIRDTLDANSLESAIITSRVKDKKSLKSKITKEEKYNHLTDVTDIIGFRIITASQDQLIEVKQVLRTLFAIDHINSISKLLPTSIEEYENKFGYKSEHIIAIIPDSIFNKFQLKFEIQLRTSLQHAWAEIEHDIGYKPENGYLPPKFRRSLSSLSSLLEIADIQLENIKKEVISFQSKVPEADKINLSSLKWIDQNEPMIISLTNSIFDSISNFQLIENSGNYRKFASELNWSGIKETNKLMKYISNNRKQIISICKKIYLNEDSQYMKGFIFEAIAILYIKEDKDKLLSFKEMFSCDELITKINTLTNV